MMMEQQQQIMAAQRAGDIERELQALRDRAARDRDTIDAYERRMKALETQLLNMQKRQDEDGRDDLIRRLQDELAQFKAKYESLAKLYAQLRKEHLDLLTKLKTIKDSESKVRAEALADVERIKAELRSKGGEMTDLLMERDRFKSDLDRLKNSQVEETERLKRELENARREVLELSRERGAEVEGLVARFNKEKSEWEESGKVRFPHNSSQFLSSLSSIKKPNTLAPFTEKTRAVGLPATAIRPHPTRAQTSPRKTQRRLYAPSRRNGLYAHGTRPTPTSILRKRSFPSRSALFSSFRARHANVTDP